MYWGYRGSLILTQNDILIGMAYDFASCSVSTPALILENFALGSMNT